MTKDLTLLETIYSEDDNKLAIVVTEEKLKITYKQYKEYVHNLSKSLSDYGLQSGDCVSLVLPNNFEFLLAFLAVPSIKAKVTLLNPAYLLDEFLFYMKDTQSKVVLVHESLTAGHALEAAAKLNIPVWRISFSNSEVHLKATPLSADKKNIEQPSINDVALILHTSGTTSQPKGVPLTHLNLSTSIQNIADTYKLTPADSSLIVMPLFHVHGLLGATMSTLHSGGSVVVPPRFSASTFWKDINEYDITWYSAVPTIHQILLSRADDDAAPRDKLRFIRSCSSSLAPIILEKLEARFGAPVLEAYGMTEASHQMASNPLPPAARKNGSVGKGTNVQIAILEPSTGKPVDTKALGEVCIKGKNVTLGYLNNPKANEENWTKDGWFRTGDQGFLDEEGYLTLTGRIKELINRGGEKIAPPEVDSVLLQHESISEAVSFGMPDEKYGEEVGAAVVLKHGVDKSDLVSLEKNIQEYAKSKMAAFKVPKKIFFADELPKTATGKTQRRFIAAHFLKK